MSQAQSTVTYKGIPGFPGYRVGDDGSVWTCKGGGNLAPLTDEWKPMRLTNDGVSGYLQVCLCHRNRIRSFKVHILVLRAFVGPPPTSCVCRHLDGTKTNNRLSNLKWGTRHENELDKVTHGTKLIGSRCTGAKLTESLVAAVRKRLAAGESGRVIARELKVHRDTIGRIKSGKTWASV